MALSILRFTLNHRILWGSLEHQHIIPLAIEADSTRELLQHRLSDLHDRRQPQLALPLVAPSQILSPVTAPCTVLCQGANYRQHAKEAGLDNAPFNLFFTKSSTSIHSPCGRIEAPHFVQLLDYEIELALVLKKDTDGIQDIRPDNLHEFIGGMCIANDISARDIQFQQGQFHKAKSYRTFCPLGPILYLLDAHEMPYLNRMQLTLSVNNSIRQHAHSSELIHSPAATLSEYSHIYNFRAGDVLLTGTPAGCALRIPSATLQRGIGLLSPTHRWRLFMALQAHRPYLRAGDRIRSHIVSDDNTITLGTQEHQVVFLANPDHSV